MPRVTQRAKKKKKDPELVALGERIRKLRLEAGLTQESLADEADIHWSYIGQIERGERNVTYKNILKLAKGLSTPVRELMP